MKGIFFRSYSLLISIVTLLLVLTTTFLIIIVFSNVIGRYFFNVSLAWAEEASRFLFIWAAFLGGVLAHEHYEHMNLDIFVRISHGKWRVAIIIASQIVTLAVLLIVFRGGFIATMDNLSWLSPALEIPYGYVYSVIPFASLLMAVQTLIRMVRTIAPPESEMEEEPRR